MQTKTVVTSSFSDPGVEAYLNNFDAELSDFAKLQGKEDAQKEGVITEALFNIKVKAFVYARVQAAIDFIKKILLVTSMVFDAAEIEQAAKRKIQEINNEINDRLHERASLKRKLGSIILDPLKTKYGKWLIIVALTVAAGDAIIAFGSFRHVYTMLQALIASVAIGAVISVSHLAYARWIKRAKTETQRVARILAILAVAFIFFAWVGKLRADTANNTVNIGLESNNVEAVNSAHLSGWAVAFISFGLFAGMLFLSLLLWKSKEERLKEQEHDKLRAEISKINTEIKALENDKVTIENNAFNQKSEARLVFDYATRSIKKCKNIGQSTIAQYKLVYGRFHNDIVPPFFAHPCDFLYDESFQFAQSPKPEQV